MKRTLFDLIFIFPILVNFVENYVVNTHLEFFSIEMQNYTNSALNEYIVSYAHSPTPYKFGTIIPHDSFRISRNMITCLPETIMSENWKDGKVTFKEKGGDYEFYPEFNYKGYQNRSNMTFKILCKNPPVTRTPILIKLQVRFWLNMYASGSTTIQTKYPSLFNNTTMIQKFDSENYEFFFTFSIEPNCDTVDLIKKLQIHALGFILSIEYLSSTGITFDEEPESKELEKVKEGVWILNIHSVNQTITINLKANLASFGKEYFFKIISQTEHDDELIQQTLWQNFTFNPEENNTLNLGIPFSIQGVLMILLLCLMICCWRKIWAKIRNILLKLGFISDVVSDISI
jgi:hypothetical protein